jgi:hypothetical protein
MTHFAEYGQCQRANVANLCMIARPDPILYVVPLFGSPIQLNEEQIPMEGVGDLGIGLNDHNVNKGTFHSNRHCINAVFIRFLM